MDALAKLEEQARSVERRNVTLSQYLAAEKDGRLPVEIWRPAKAPGRGSAKPVEPELLASEEEIKRRLAALPADARVVYDTEDPKLREGAVVIRSKVYEHGEIERTVKALQKMGVDTRTWAPLPAPAGSAAPSKPPKPIGRYVLEGADPVEVTSLRDLLARGPQGRPARGRRPALQGSRRDEPRPAEGHDDGPGAPHAGQDPHRGRRPRPTACSAC